MTKKEIIFKAATVFFAEKGYWECSMAELAQVELAELEPRAASLAEALKLMLLPKDPRDDRNVIVEVRAGTGGEEAALFAGDLLRMYLRYSERQGWKTELIDAT